MRYLSVFGGVSSSASLEQAWLHPQLMMSAHHTSPLRPHGEDLLKVNPHQYRPQIPSHSLTTSLPEGRPLRSLLRPPRSSSRLSLLPAAVTTTTTGCPSPFGSSRPRRAISVILSLRLHLRLSRRTGGVERQVRRSSGRMAPAKCRCACARRGGAGTVGGASGA